MEEVKSEGWRQILQPKCVAGKNNTSRLLRSSSWRRPGERGYYEGPAAQVNEPSRRARPRSCTEGGRMDKWLQTLERLQSRPLQKQIPKFTDRTVSTPVLPNELMGSNPCPDLSSLCRRNQSPSVCPSVSESLESHARSKTVHIKPAPSVESSQFCALAPVRFGWLPIQRHVILMDNSNNRQDNSSCQKLKSPITPVLLSTPAKLNRPRPNDREPARPQPAGFRYWRTPEKTSSILHQASGSMSFEGLRAWNPKASVTSKGEAGKSQPHPDNPTLKDPTGRRRSAPESSSSSISSITITSRKVAHTSNPPCSGHLSSTAMNELNAERGKALVVKVTEQRTKSSSCQPVALTPGCDHEEIDHGVVLRRKATIVKMTERSEHFNRGKPNTAHYRHSYTEGLKTNEAKVNPSPLNPALTVSLEPGGNQWRSQHRSSLSLYLNNPNDNSAEMETNTEKHKPLRRPLSCDASLFNRTELVANAAFHNKSSPVPQKTNIDLVSSSRSESRRRSTSSCEYRSSRKEGFEWDRALEKHEEPLSEMKPLTLLKVADNSPHLSADAVLALNAAAVIANIKLQVQQRQKDEQRRTTSHTATAVSLAEDRGNNGHRELIEEADGKNKTPPEGPCVEFDPFESQNVPPEPALSLSDALAIRRPDFIQRSQARVRALECRSQERKRAQISPQRPEPAGIQQQQQESLLKSKDRSMNGKGLQLRSRRNYDQLPEVRKRREEEKRKKDEEKRKLASRTNRLRAELFKKKLLEQILQRGGNP